ncbi:MAG: AzlD domain-containing protein [Acidimicrobiales bacterium]
MTITAIVLIAAGVWGQRLAGMFLVGPLLEKRPVLAQAAALIPAAVICAVIVQLTIADGKSLVVDERLAGLAVAGVLVWRRAPFIVIVIAAAATTAALRSLG